MKSANPVYANIKETTIQQPLGSHIAFFKGGCWIVAFYCPMTWINIFIPNMRAPEFINSEPSARSTWLSILAFCCEQENGGVIEGAESWTDRAWLQTCGVTGAEARKSSPLVSFENGNVTVWNYPEDKEKEVQLKRKAGKRGGLAKAANRSSASCATSCASGVLQAVPVAQPLAVLLRKGREEELEGKENGNGKEPQTPPPPPKPKSDNRPTTPQAKRFADIFGRKHSTAWSLKEIASYKALGIIPEDDMAILEKYYASGYEYLRKDLATLLNNFAGELDRARKMFPPKTNGAPKPALDPEGWREWCEAKGYPYMEYGYARGYMKEEFNAEKRR